MLLLSPPAAVPSVSNRPDLHAVMAPDQPQRYNNANLAEMKSQQPQKEDAAMSEAGISQGSTQMRNGRKGRCHVQIQKNLSLSLSLAQKVQEGLKRVRPGAREPRATRGQASPFRTLCLQKAKIKKLNFFCIIFISLTRNLIQFVVQASLPLLLPRLCLSPRRLMQGKTIVAGSRRGSPDPCWWQDLSHPQQVSCPQSTPALSHRICPCS